MGLVQVDKVNKEANLDKANKDGYSGEDMTTMATKTVKVREAARTLGVHENTIRNWESRGLLKAIRLPGSGFRRFRPEDVQRLAAEMFDQLAPAVEGPVRKTERKPSGRFVHGDDN
jgi:excisionase family DNA binding protein